MSKYVIMVQNTASSVVSQTPQEIQKEYDTLKLKTGKTSDDFKKLTELKLKLNSTGQKSIGDLQRELSEAEKNEDRDLAIEIQKKIDDLKNNTPAQEIDAKKEISNIIDNKKKGALSNKEKEDIKKLLEVYQRQRESKNQSLEDEKKLLGEKPQNAVLNDLYTKLLDQDKDMKEPDFTKKIGKVNSSILPFIPSLKGKTNPDLKKEGIISFNLGEVEILTYSGWKRRNKINRVANELNNIDTDSEKAIRYLFSMSNKRSGGRPGALMKQAFRSRFDAKKMFNRDPESFMKTVNEQLDKFIKEITDGHETEEVKEIQKGIKDRFDYHIRNYKAIQAQKWMTKD